MLLIKLVVFGVFLRESLGAKDLVFPSWFQFGAATAAYQVEGAWNISDKGESIWDRFVHKNPGAIADGSSGDVACDSYHHWKRDVQMACELGLDFYRFSISWPRLLPSGFTNHISENGKNYYNNLIDELLKNGVEPRVTLHHFDMPQTLQDLGGWTNPLIADWFADYARVAYTLFGDRVKVWFTINEPIIVCDLAYNTGIHAPGIKQPNSAAYLCNKNILISHAKAWRTYDEEFKDKYHGKVSIVNNLSWYDAESPDDDKLAELVRQYGIGRYMHPIYSKQGGWPPSIEKFIEEKSEKEGYTFLRLPSFTIDEALLVKGTYDFIGLNHYTAQLVRKPKPGEKVGSFVGSGVPDLGAVLDTKPGLQYGSMAGYTYYPEGLGKLTSWLKKEYGDIDILITENGYYDTERANIKDDGRIMYINGFLTEILRIIREDKVNITGYTVWSMMDNFEWSEGYKPKFGMYQVDFSSHLRTRSPRKSAHYYKKVIETGSLPDMGDFETVRKEKMIPLKI